MQIPPTIVLIVATVVVGLLGYVWWNQSEDTAPSINNFEECEQAGYPIMESYPRQCRAPNGVTYVEEIVVEPGICVDQCGDGTCAEIVCLGTGCPCAETASLCPGDCS